MHTSTTYKLGFLAAILATTMAAGCAGQTVANDEDAPDAVAALTNNDSAMQHVVGKWENKATPAFGRLKFIELQAGGHFNAVFWTGKNTSVSGTYQVGSGADSAKTELIQIREVPTPGQPPQLSYPTKTYTNGTYQYHRLDLSQVSSISGGKYTTFTTQDMEWCDTCSILDYSTDTIIPDSDSAEQSRTYVLTPSFVSVTDSADLMVCVNEQCSRYCKDSTSCSGSELIYYLSTYVDSWTLTGKELSDGLDVKVMDYNRWTSNTQLGATTVSVPTTDRKNGFYSVPYSFGSVTDLAFDIAVQ